jgi:hypothetical protein
MTARISGTRKHSGRAGLAHPAAPGSPANALSAGYRRPNRDERLSVAAELAERGYVVMPVRSGGASVISTARRGTQPLGGQSSQKTQIALAVGLAALGASTPCHPPRQSVSPTC